jgi:hypothetical protein
MHGNLNLWSYVACMDETKGCAYPSVCCVAVLFDKWATFICIMSHVFFVALLIVEHHFKAPSSNGLTCGSGVAMMYLRHLHSA